MFLIVMVCKISCVNHGAGGFPSSLLTIGTQRSRHEQNVLINVLACTSKSPMSKIRLKFPVLLWSKLRNMTGEQFPKWPFVIPIG